MARITVQLKDGRKGTIDDTQYDPGSMSRIDVSPPQQNNQTTSNNQNQGGLASILGGGLNNILSAASKPFRVAGEGAIDIGRLIGDKTGLGPKITGYEKPVLISQDEQNDVANNATNTNPLQNSVVKEAAGLGSYAVPFGKVASSAPLLSRVLGNVLLPGAASGALQGISEKDATLNSVEGNALLGAGGASALHGAGILGSKLFGGIGKSLESTGNDLALKTLRPSPSQQSNFFRDTGQKLGDFLHENNLQGAGYEEIAKKATPLQEAFNGVVENPDIRINNSTITSSFDKKIAELSKSSLPEQKAKANYLTEVKNNLSTQLQEGDTGADIITGLRREADNLVKKFNTDETSKDKLQMVRDIYTNIVRDTADQAGITIDGMSAKEAGSKLSKFYKLQDIADKQQYLGQGGNLLGLTDFLGAGVGATAGIPGVLGGLLASKVVKSPKFLSSASKATTNVGSGIGSTNDAINQILQSASGNNITGQINSRLPNMVSQLVSGSQENEGNKQESKTESDNNILGVSQNNNSLTSNVSQGEDKVKAIEGAKAFLTMKMLEDASKGGKNIDKLKSIASALDQLSPAKSAQKTDSQVAREQTGEITQDAYNQFVNNPNIKTGPLGSLEDLKSRVNLGDQSTLDFNNVISNLAATIAKQRGGTSFTPSEQKMLDKYTPKVGDSRQQLLTKLKGLQTINFRSNSQ